ncbi:MAG TPA: FAD-dependent oxidoreductase [Sphingomonadales bacterium]
MERLHYDIVIIGAGPAGLAALSELAGKGLEIAVMDEQPRAGGQIYRQPPADFRVKDWLPGQLYDAGKALLRRAEQAPGVHWHLETAALGFYEDAAGERVLWAATPEGVKSVSARAWLVAAGCYDMPVAFPGWTLPGVMAAGGVQAFVKSQQLVPGERFVFAGSHPLQLIVAEQVLNAGGEIAALIFSQPPGRALAALRRPGVVGSHWRKFAAAAAAFARLKRAGVPILFEHGIVAAEGEDAVASAVIAPLDADGRADRSRSRSVACDRIAFCYGFLPSSELARQAGATAVWDEDAGGGWIVTHDGAMRSDVPRLYVAGEVTRVAGAESAAEQGRIAAFSILADLGLPVDRAARDAAFRRLGSITRFADLLRDLARPPAALIADLAGDDVVLCRCENVSFGAFRAAMKEAGHVLTADAAKLLSRTGMGPCQGRYCGHAVRRTLAEIRGTDPGMVGGFTVRPPVKPVPLGDIVG